ncbi:hypothetical protein PoB_006787800 [Plakobranchus ocellatus]|uniref:Uncharacterized protein n=1 Tax=Plakobranchus ocellatus TaxID=259542 RepID=A0AAV4DAZ2_9GAST|nr:hypothetical protein PoB_006787800 [Plakobranchus ocellatus]
MTSRKMTIVMRKRGRSRRRLLLQLGYRQPLHDDIEEDDNRDEEERQERLLLLLGYRQPLHDDIEEDDNRDEEERQE